VRAALRAAQLVSAPSPEERVEDNRMHQLGLLEVSRGRARPGAAAPQTGEDHRDRTAPIRRRPVRARRAGPEVPIPVDRRESADLLVQLNDRPEQQLRGRLEHGPRRSRPSTRRRHQAGSRRPRPPPSVRPTAPSRRHGFGGAQQAAAGVGAVRPAGRGEPGEPNRRARRGHRPAARGACCVAAHRACRRSPGPKEDRPGRAELDHRAKNHVGKLWERRSSRLTNERYRW
jgi:hypothetical protein